MHSWRVTKYDPLNRDINGFYLDSNEWTCFSDVGKTVSLEKYLQVEQKYVNAIIAFMNEMDINKLYINDLEQYSEEIRAQNVTEFVSKLWIGKGITIGEIEELIKLTLRNVIWCKLELKKQFFVHFGYDYYMYIGARENCYRTQEKVTSSGLYIEEFVSPYLK
ncbi:hypothetical protein [Metabacillus fastidiosus]|uniref:hypothetical protein n=1 Tax=Metabacillus fastidiosus TaxID=1458 RepID=UPI002E1B6316|nr:hypothetical protein [Metabacillus fastidiosus]